MTWIVELLDWLFFWLPRFWFVQPDEGGVRVTLGKNVKECPPGWYIEWPIIHTTHNIEVTTQGVRFAVQSVTTADDADLAVRGAVLYSVSDAPKFIFETANLDKTLEVITCGVIESFIANKTYEDVRDRKALKAEIMSGLSKESSGWGIRLLRVFITDIGRVQNIRVLGDNQSIIPLPEEE